VSLRLNEALLSELRRQGERAYPSECCGVLGGTIGAVREVVRLVPAANRRTDDPHRYLIAPGDLQRIEAELNRGGLEVLGFYHSHPDHPAEPSRYDTEHAWPWYSYLILRVNQGQAVEATAWQLADDRSVMEPESLEVFSEV
jgi:proteasome lid subunit RPN8/RPN11